VLRAFKTLDFNGDGILTINDLRQKYNASMHPDVKSGKRTEDEVLTEFIETFELHHNILNGSRSDGSITPDEFLEYYSHVSSNIESDAYFELLMSNAWNLESRTTPTQCHSLVLARKLLRLTLVRHIETITIETCLELTTTHRLISKRKLSIRLPSHYIHNPIQLSIFLRQAEVH